MHFGGPFLADGSRRTGFGRCALTEEFWRMDFSVCWFGGRILAGNILAWSLVDEFSRIAVGWIFADEN